MAIKNENSSATRENATSWLNLEIPTKAGKKVLMGVPVYTGDRSKKWMRKLDDAARSHTEHALKLEGMLEKSGKPSAKFKKYCKKHGLDPKAFFRTDENGDHAFTKYLQLQIPAYVVPVLDADEDDDDDWF